MQNNHPTGFLKKLVRSQSNSNSILWKNIFYIKDLLRSFSSDASLAYDHLLFSFQQDNSKKIFGQNEDIRFETYCINLARRPDKRQFIERQFDNINFNLKMFPAFDGAMLDPVALVNQSVLSPDNKDLSSGKSLSPAQIGVYLSHLEIWKKAAKSVDQITFILEDDALITCDSPTLQKYIRHIPEDADIFFINHRRNKKQHINPYISKFVGRFWGLTAYFVTRKGAEKLLQLAIPIHMSADDMVSRLNEKGLINCYCSRQELVVECSNAKDNKNFRFASDILDRTQ